MGDATVNGEYAILLLPLRESTPCFERLPLRHLVAQLRQSDY